ncbi:MAG: DUF1810 domain-containing protein [Ilumatobacteraceae bacterium]
MLTPDHAEPDLGRFVDAYRDDFDRALREIEAGRKQSHWMWYIFPQVGGLGVSAMSRRYAIGNLDEAEAFLLHPVLGDGYCCIVDAVWHQVIERSVSIRSLFGSPDVTKLVSSLTLFAGIASALDSPPRSLTTLLERAGQLLEAAHAQGLGPCTTTETFLRRR